MSTTNLKLELNKIHREHCLDTMARMPDEFVDCVPCSPPYYGLRSYSAPDSIWGGKKDCNHVFDKKISLSKSGGTGKASEKAKLNAKISFSSTSAFCACGAWKGQLGLEPTFQLYLDHLIQIFAEVKRVLKKDGTVWANLGDSFASKPVGKFNGGGTVFNNRDLSGHQSSGTMDKTKCGVREKSLMNIPARFAIRMTDELGFIQRNEIIWHKPACMPSSAKDRFTVDFEKIFFFTKSEKYYFEQQLENLSAPRHLKRTSINGNGNGELANTQRFGSDVNGRNMRTTWSVNYEPSSENHYASYPTRLVEIPIRAGSREGGIVYDPFAGTGTSLVVAHKLGRQFIGSEISAEYVEIANKRLAPILAQESLF